jgi:hypothetical protein
MKQCFKCGAIKPIDEFYKHPKMKGGNKKTEAHHNDYRNPLDVTWLCKKHHLLAHGKNGHCV